MNSEISHLGNPVLLFSGNFGLNVRVAGHFTGGLFGLALVLMDLPCDLVLRA
jgi:hypothetical protein